MATGRQRPPWLVEASARRKSKPSSQENNWTEQLCVWFAARQKANMKSPAHHTWLFLSIVLGSSCWESPAYNRSSEVCSVCRVMKDRKEKKDFSWQEKESEGGRGIARHLFPLVLFLPNSKQSCKYITPNVSLSFLLLFPPVIPFSLLSSFPPFLFSLPFSSFLPSFLPPTSLSLLSFAFRVRLINTMLKTSYSFISFSFMATAWEEGKQAVPACAGGWCRVG